MGYCLQKSLIANFRPDEYKKKVAEYVKKYATEEALRDQCGDQVCHLSL